MSAELLREAAALMRERAESAATGYAWTAKPHSSRRDCDTVQDASGIFMAHYCLPGFANHAASWHPAVALAVADWLEDTATANERAAVMFADALDGRSAINEKALAVARAYLGGVA